MNDERRRFFRITDTVGVAYRILSPDEVDSRSNGVDSPSTTYSLLSNYDSVIDNLLQQIHGQYPLVEEALATLNKKINCVINQLELDNQLVQRLAHRVQEVNISACGMGFVADQTIAVGQTLNLDIALQPENEHVFTFATVVSSEPLNDSDECYVRVNFHGLRPEDQETLIQHIVKRQSVVLRHMREARSR